MVGGVRVEEGVEAVGGDGEGDAGVCEWSV